MIGVEVTAAAGLDGFGQVPGMPWLERSGFGVAGDVSLIAFAPRIMVLRRFPCSRHWLGVTPGAMSFAATMIALPSSGACVPGIRHTQRKNRFSRQ